MLHYEEEGHAKDLVALLCLLFVLVYMTFFCRDQQPNSCSDLPSVQARAAALQSLPKLFIDR
jgi:hypothetical protein